MACHPDAPSGPSSSPVPGAASTRRPVCVGVQRPSPFARSRTVPQGHRAPGLPEGPLRGHRRPRRDCVAVCTSSPSARPCAPHSPPALVLRTATTEPPYPSVSVSETLPRSLTVKTGMNKCAFSESGNALLLKGPSNFF